MSETNPIKRMLLCLILALAFAACDLRQDISFYDPPEEAWEGPSVAVLWEENEVEVFVDSLDKVVVEEGTVWLLWDILLAAGLKAEDISSMRFDFESADGFRASSKGCTPLQGESLALGYVDPEGLNLRWDSSLGLRGCYWVTRLARILGEPGL